MLSFLEGDRVAAGEAVQEGLAIGRTPSTMQWLVAYCSVGLAMLEADAGRLEEALVSLRRDSPTLGSRSSPPSSE